MALSLYRLLSEGRPVSVARLAEGGEREGHDLADLGGIDRRPQADQRDRLGWPALGPANRGEAALGGAPLDLRLAPLALPPLTPWPAPLT